MRLGQGKGDTENSDCNLSANLQTDPHPDFAEASNNLQAQWIAKDTIMVVATSSKSSTNIWLGSKLKTGLFQFKKHDDSISETVDPESLKVSPTGWKTIILVTQDVRYMYVSNDAGHSWSRHDLPDIVFNPFRDIMMSSISPSHMALVSTFGKLYTSTNYGQTWSYVTDKVYTAYFVNITDSKEFLFYSTGSRFNIHFHNIYTVYRLDLSRSNDEPKVLIDNVYRFYVDNKYLYISKQNISHQQAQNNTRRFYVSTDFYESHPSFTEVQLPAAHWEDHVQIMATHETGAFIHYSTGKDKEKGNLYVSDAGGARFSLSLENHLFKRYTILDRTLSFNDFYEVKSMRGVYITTNVSNIDGKTYHSSVITFNNGGSWNLISPPENTDCLISKGCSLHLHVKYSSLVSYSLYNSSVTTGPLSSGNAVGIIVAHGSIGNSRDYDPKQAVIVTSQDGGYTWTKPNIPPGLYSYGIADYGNIIAIIPDSEHAGSLWFSHDRGVCFKKEQLDTTGYFSLTKGLLMDPKATSLYAFALGLEGNNDDDQWRLIAINFESILVSRCHEGDYITVTEHSISNTCILGYQAQYKIAKPSSICFNDEKYSPAPIDIKKCDCTYTDMECDYGYTPIWSNNILSCKAIEGFDLSSVCPPDEKYYYQSSSGLRLIAGDLCKNTSASVKLLRFEQKICTGHEKDSGNIDTTDKESSHGANTVGKVVGGIIIVVVLLIAAGLSVYCVMRCRKQSRQFHDRVVYKKIPLTGSGLSSDNSSDEDLLN